MIRYRVSRMTKEPRTSQKDAAWRDHGRSLHGRSGNDTLPALARQIYYQARPKIMAMTDDKELQYGYFSQTLLPDYIEENGVSWNVVYDARGHFEEPHTNRRIGCRDNRSRQLPARDEGAGNRPGRVCRRSVDVIGPSGNISGVCSARRKASLHCSRRWTSPIVMT